MNGGGIEQFLSVLQWLAQVSSVVASLISSASPCLQKYDISVAKHFYDGMLASAHPLEGPDGNLASLLNVNVQAGATTLFPFGEEECGKKHNVTLVMVQMNLYMLFSSICLACSCKGNLFLKYHCPNLCCSGAVIFQFIIDGKFKEAWDKRFGKCVFCQGMEHELSCFNFVPSPQMPSPFENLQIVMIHGILINVVVKSLEQRSWRTLARRLKAFLIAFFSTSGRCHIKQRSR
jgi:hypothetical protein